MEPRNKWIIGGLIAAIGALGFLYWKSKQAASANAANQYSIQVVPSGTATNAISPAGVNPGDFNSTGYNGLGTGITQPSSAPLEIAPGITLASTGLTLAQWAALSPQGQQLVIAHFGNPANQVGGANYGQPAAGFLTAPSAPPAPSAPKGQYNEPWINQGGIEVRNPNYIPTG